MELTERQKKAMARIQLFRQLRGSCLMSFINKAIKEHAITNYEESILLNIEDYRKKIIDDYFNNTKKVGLRPKRRCAYCKNVAHYKAVIVGKDTFLCTKHKKETINDNKQNSKDEWMVTDIHKINPYE